MIQRFPSPTGIHGDLVDSLRDCFNRRDPVTQIPAVKQVLAAHLERIRRINREGSSGNDTVRFISEMVDTLLRVLWDQMEMSVPNEAQLVSLVAVGGYGRMELCPKSDIDLLILTSPNPTADEISQAETIVRSLWDYGFVVGSSVRSLAQCKEAAGSDPETWTSFLNERFVAGNHELYRKFVKLMDKRLLPWRISKLVEAKLKERDSRISRMGALVQLLEPDLKEGLGCLRDVHSMMWIAKVRHDCDNLGDLVREGLINPQELEDLRVAYDFLLQVRCCVHFLTNKKDDRLSFHLQPDVAQELGFREEAGQRPVENFLKVFYHHTKTINRVTEAVVSRWVTTKEKSGKIPALKDHPHFREEEGFIDLRYRVGNPFADSLDLILDYYDIANKYGLGYSHHAMMRLRQAVGRLMGQDSLDTRDALRRFLLLCQRRERVGRMLRSMNDVRLVSLLIPDFQYIYCHSQHDIYHIYTTDEHTLTVVRQLSYLAKTTDKEKASLRSALAEVEDQELLILSCIFHDIGKGVGPGHSQSGARMVYAFMEAMDFSPSRCQQASGLVLHHLLMNEVIQRRDLDDPKTIRDFLAKIETPAMLHKLYVLTYCDVSSVHPDAWSTWKATLLQKLYETALEELHKPFQASLASDRLKDQLLENVGNRVPEEVLRQHLEVLPRQYAASTTPEEVVMHIQMISALASGKFGVKVVERPSHWEITLVANDEKGLLSAIAGTLAHLELSILSARIFTRTDGKVIDKFWVAPPDPPDRLTVSSLAQKMTRELERHFSLSDNELQELQSRWQRRSAALRSIRDLRMEPEVAFSNNVSEAFSTIDITCNDRIGLLHQVTKVLSRLSLTIHGAILTTEADKAMDAFYITDVQGDKLVREDAITTLIADLKKELG